MSHSESWQEFIELLEPFHDQAVATTRRLCRCHADGDDLFQEAVIRAHRKFSTLRDPARFRPWFYAVLLSVHRNRSRRAFWRRFLPLDRLDASDEPVGQDGVEREERYWRADRVSRALGELPSVQREAIVLFEIEGFSVEEIAAMQKVSPSAVKSRLARGRVRLKRHYERIEEANQRYISTVAPTPRRATKTQTCPFPTEE